jgi:hypothetical protein
MVDVGGPSPYHAMLREIFDLERVWREGSDSGEGNEYEQTYVTAHSTGRCRSLES